MKRLNFWTKFLARDARKRRRQKQAGATIRLPRIEPLESRTLLAVGFGNSLVQQIVPVGATSTLTGFTAGVGNDRLLLVQVGTFGNVTNVTYNGQALTPAIDQVHSTSTMRQEIWYATLGSGAAATGNIVATGVSGTTTIGASVFTGVDQLTPVDNFNTAQFNLAATSSTLNVNSDSGDMVFDAVHWQAAFPSSTTPGANQIQSYAFLTSSPSAAVLAASYEPGPGPVVMSETFNAVQVNNGLHGALNLNQVATDIRGRKFEDLDADRTDDGGADPGLVNVTMRLYADGGNGKFGSDGQGKDAGTGLNGDDDVLVTTTLTGASGNYEFKNLLNDTYYVQEVVPANFVATTPTFLALVSAGGNDFSAQNFGNTVLGSIHGFKFLDVNVDGVFTQGTDQPLRDQLFRLTGTDGQGNIVDATVRSDANGRFQFTNLFPSISGQGPGTGYVVTELPSDQYVPTTATSWPTNLQSRQEFTAFAGQAALNAQQVEVVIGAPLMFGNSPSCSIHGFKYEDVNGDGVYQIGADQPLANVTFTLTGRNALGQPVNLTTATGADGEFSFSHLMASDATGYAVTEVLPAGYVATTANTFSRVLNPGQELVATPGQARLVEGVWGVQPDTGRIVEINATTGAIINSFPVPDGLQPGDQIAGLTIAEGGRTLLYSNGGANGNPSLVYRLDPIDGTVLSIETMTGAGGGGLSYDSASGNIIGINGAVLAQDGFGGPVSTLYAVAPIAPGALGGDDYSRQFVATGSSINEFNGAGTAINSFINYVPSTAGLAYDGTWLYASSLNGYVYWLNPANGAFVWWVFVNGGELIGLAANNVPQTEVVIGEPLIFGNAVRGSIHGIKFEDVDGDGEFDNGEPRVAGVTFTVTGTDGLGNAVQQSVSTNQNGEFAFTNLMPSVVGAGPATGYTVTETVPAGWASSTPTTFTADLFSRSELVAVSGQASIPQNDPRVEVVVGKPLIFGNTVRGSIHAFKFEDCDGDGRFDGPHVDQQQSIGNSITIVAGGFFAAQTFTPNETMFVDNIGFRVQRVGIPGDLTVEIREVTGGLPSGNVLATATVLQNSVSESTSAGVVADFSNAGLLLFADRQYAIVFSAPTSGANTYRINQEPTGNRYAAGQALFSNNSGATWTDFGFPGADLLFNSVVFEPPVAGVEFRVTGTDSLGNAVDRTETTNGDGQVWFTDLWPSVAGQGQGTGYLLTETVPTGWINTTPTTYATNLFSRHEYTALPGQAMLPLGDPRIEIVVGDPLKFGNAVTGSIHGFKYEDVNGNGQYNAAQPNQQQTIQDSTVTVTNQRVAQTFTPSITTTLESINLLIGRAGNPGNLIVEIQETTGGQPNGNVLGTATIAQTSIGTTVGLIDIEFGATRAFLLQGTTYAMVVRAANGTAANNYRVSQSSAGNPYAAGQLLSSTNGGATWTATANADLYFIANMGERRVAGVAFTLTGIAGAGGVVNQTVITDNNGEFAFTGLLPSVFGQGFGTGYTLTESVPAGWINTTPTSYATDLFGRTELVSLPGQALIPTGDLREEFLVGVPLRFGNAVHSSIHGLKFDDVDANGIYTAGVDLPLAGVAFTLTGVDGIGNVVNQTVTTDINGEFGFTQLRPSVNGAGPATGYTVTETVPSGWLPTTATIFLTSLYDATELVALAGQADLIQNDLRKEIVRGTPLLFGNTRPGSIHGLKFEDINADGIFTSGVDQRLANVDFVLTGTDGRGNVVNRMATTNINGEFAFTNLLASVNNGIGPGTGYTVTEVVPTGHVATSPTTYTANLFSRQELVALAGQAAIPLGDARVEVVVGVPLFFGNTVPGSIHGIKFEDLNLDGTYDSNTIPSPTFAENFDGVVAPALPAGWTNSTTVGSATWRTSSSGPDTPPNAAFIIDDATNTDARLTSPVIPIASATTALSFRHSFSFDEDFDGGVLEISINGGTFTDIIAAGGSFLAGGYNGTLNGLENNPLGVRDAWVESSSGYMTTVVDLPAATAGQNVQFRWRIAAGDTFGDIGWSIDTIQVGELFNEPGLAGVTFTLTGVNGQGTPVNQTVTTNADGEFWFTGLIASVTGAGFGTGYTVTEIVPNRFYPSTSTRYFSNLFSRQELVAFTGQAMLGLGDPQIEVVVGAPLAFGNISAGDRIGVHRSSNFYQDVNGSGAYEASDTIRNFGATNDTPLVGDWDGDGDDDVGVHRGNQFYLDANGNGAWDGVAGGDRLYTFGIAGDKPLAGDWDGDGDDEIGAYRASVFYLDVTGDGSFNAGDVSNSYGATTDQPLTGDWDNDGDDDIGVFRNGVFYLDSNGSGAYNTGDAIYNFGNPGDTPIRGRWSEGGPDKIGVHRGDGFYLDVDGNGSFGGIDVIERYGAIGDRPIIGNWPSPPPLLAADGPAAGARDVAPLSSGDLASVVAAAIEMFSNSGLDAQQIQLIQQVQFDIADLPGARLGEAQGNQMTIDTSASGYGWFVDATPHDDEEFSALGGHGLVALGDSAASGHIDLLTVVFHELGHLLGLDDNHVGSEFDDLMYSELDLGIRRRP